MPEAISQPISMRDVLLKLSRREDLTREEAREAFELIMSGQASEAQIGGLLIGLASKGTTADELIGAATVMREKAVPVSVKGDGSGDGPDDSAGAQFPDDNFIVDSTPPSSTPPSPTPASQHGNSPADSSSRANQQSLSSASDIILDTCGTGGDVKGTFNISTASAIIAAACGVRVVKHGNRSASSKSGSADVLEKLGVKLEVSGDTLGRCAREANICFAFARSHHPAMKHVAPVRSSLGIPTIFNLLGPLTNPARAKHQVLGVFSPELTDRMAAVLLGLGSVRAWVVHALDGLDELSTLGPTRVSELRDGQIHTRTIDCRDVGIPYARLSDLQVDSVDEAAAALIRVLAGEKGAMYDIATLNAAAALVVAERAATLEEGLALARHALDSGKAHKTLEALVRVSNTEESNT